MDGSFPGNSVPKPYRYLALLVEHPGFRISKVLFVLGSVNVIHGETGIFSVVRATMTTRLVHASDALQGTSHWTTFLFGERMCVNHMTKSISVLNT